MHSLHVSIKVTTLGRFVGAIWTAEWLLAGMNAHVLPHIILVTAPIRTLGAMVR